MPEQDATSKQMHMALFLQYYKRRDVQEAILRHAQNREVSPRYGEGFGKRPDVLLNPADIMEFAKKKTTSFHVSEERWENPLLVQTGMPRKELDSLRSGWDLVLDIDAPDWEISRLTAWLFVQVLRQQGINAISVKFSGNKGWHIGVPFESFPPTILTPEGQDVQTKNLFPDLPRAIATMLIDEIGNTDNGLVVIGDDVVKFSLGEKNGKTRYLTKRLADLATQTNKKKEDLIGSYCPSCKKTVARAKEQHALCCASCFYRVPEKYTHEEKELVDDAKRVCPRCKHIMDFILLSKSSCAHNPAEYQMRFDITQIVEVDTVLLASRHLYRMPYSLHEKSGLASVVIDPNDVLTFKKTDASPKTISLERTFLDPTMAVPGEASALAQKALVSAAMATTQKPERLADFEIIEDAIPSELFPPCIQKILLGLQDGKKRAMFALTNFLTVCGWSKEMIDAELTQWNARNPEALREVILKGHLRMLSLKKERIPPPNCKSFYQDLGVCTPDEMCGMIKNPAQYAVRKSKMGGKKKRAKKKEVKAEKAPPTEVSEPISDEHEDDE